MNRNAPNATAQTGEVYWPYATTLFVTSGARCPTIIPGIFRRNEVYSAAAFVLFMKGIVTESQEPNERTLPQIKMPNRNGNSSSPISAPI
jgi:hypothetical protein